mgnify:CR=1 FL=1
MKLNPDCMRVILKYCVEHIDYKDIGLNQWHENSVTLAMLYNNEELKRFEKKEIMYSVMKLYEYRFITVGRVQPMDGQKYFDSCDITDVTVTGHEFYNAIQEDTIWNKTKNIVGQVGNHTLKFIEDTAQKIAVESAKQVITLAVMKK